jgi:energy-coupling factor transporter transmembrane protein EcfT
MEVCVRLWVLVCCVGNIVLNILFPLLGVSVVVLSVVVSVVVVVLVFRLLFFLLFVLLFFLLWLFFFFLLVDSWGTGKWGLQEGDYDDATASAELHAKSIALSTQVNTSYNVMQQDVSRP